MEKERERNMTGSERSGEGEIAASPPRLHPDPCFSPGRTREVPCLNPFPSFVRDRKAMARTPADVKELPHAYVFEVNIPGINPRKIKVQVEDNNHLIICGERKHEEETREKEGSAGAKYLRMERQMGRFLRTFLLPENADTEAISANCKDGVLTVMIEKVPPPEPKKPRTVEVQVAIGLL